MSDQEILRFLQRMISVLLFNTGALLLVFLTYRAVLRFCMDDSNYRARLARARRYMKERARRRLRK